MHFYLGGINYQKPKYALWMIYIRWQIYGTVKYNCSVVNAVVSNLSQEN
jgi:hypothetical protein